MMSLALVLPAVWSIQGEGHPLGHGLPPAVLQMNAKRASLSHHCQIAAACDRFEVLSVSIRPDSPFLANLELPIALLHIIAENYCTALNADRRNASCGMKSLSFTIIIKDIAKSLL